MSEKKTKQDRKLKVMTEEADNLEVAKNMAASIRKMYEDRDTKALAAKERIVSQLEVTSDKYLTGNGVMSALETVRLVLGGNGNTDASIIEDISCAKTLAIVMSRKAEDMANKAKKLDPDKMDKLCDGFYITNFAETEASTLDLMEELMVLQLCQNVGPSAEDIVEFLCHIDEEIEKARQNLKTFCAEHGLSFNELCGPHDGCVDCLCMDCAKDCKDNKKIEVGQSAYDVCKDFVSNYDA